MIMPWFHARQRTTCIKTGSGENGITMKSLGRLDILSHILPGIDDGCPDLEATLKCVRQFVAAGYGGTICTPHIIPGSYPRNTPRQVREWVAGLQAELTRNEIDYQVWAGGELTLAADNWDWFERDGIPTLGSSRAVLMDWWGASWPDFADHTMDRLLDSGYQPILAHPERMRLPVDELLELVKSLASRGVWLQGNLNSLSGGEGNLSRELSQAWLQAGQYRFLASDTHHPDRMAGRLDGLQVAIDLIGEEQVHELVAVRTHLLVECP